MYKTCENNSSKKGKTILLLRLQAQTLPDATPPTGKIHPFCKIAVIFEPVMQLGCTSRFRISLYDSKPHL